MRKTIAQALIEEGKQLAKAEAIEAGKQLGIIMAKQEDLIKLLNSKTGLLPQIFIEKIKSIHQVEPLDALFGCALALIKDGRKLGTLAAKQEYLIRLLNRRFDSFPRTLIEKIRSIHRVEHLDTLFDRALTAKTINEMEIALAEISTES